MEAKVFKLDEIKDDLNFLIALYGVDSMTSNLEYTMEIFDLELGYMPPQHILRIVMCN